MTDRELLKQALEALQWTWGGEPLGSLIDSAITGIKKRLAEDDDEPVLWVDTDDNGDLYWDEDRMVSDTPVYFDNPIPLYRRPLPMARLTDEEILDAANQADFMSMVTVDDYIYVIARAIEDKIWEKAE